MVGSRGFIAAQGAIDCTRGRGRGRLVGGQSQKTLYWGENHHVAMDALNQRTGCNLKRPEVNMRRSATINKNRKRRINRVPRRSSMWHTLLCRHCGRMSRRKEVGERGDRGECDDALPFSIISINECVARE